MRDGCPISHRYSKPATACSTSHKEASHKASVRSDTDSDRSLESAWVGGSKIFTIEFSSKLLSQGNKKAPRWFNTWSCLVISIDQTLTAASSIISSPFCYIRVVFVQTRVRVNLQRRCTFQEQRMGRKALLRDSETVHHGVMPGIENQAQ